MKQLSLKVAQTVEVIFKPDKTTYQSEMPEELEEVIATDPGAKLAFDSLTPGAKRSFIYWVKQVKSTEKRIERALKIADAFRNGITSVQKMLR